MCRKHHRITSALLSLVMTIAVIAAPAFVPMSANGHTALAATTFSDIADHWSKAYVEKAVEFGIVNGYSDGTFRPDQPVTRAEFTKLINTALGNTSTVTPELTDVDASQWFYTDIAKGVAASFINGYDDYSFRPDATITRQEAAVILSRIVPTAGVEAAINSYDDASDVALWAENAMKKIVGKRYMVGTDDNRLIPTEALTRGQAAKIIVEIKATERIISSNQTIIKEDITIQNTIYANQISVGAQVGSGRATLDNCVVLGNVNVQGGGGEGDRGLFIKDSRIVKLTVDRDDNNVQVFSQGDSTVLNTHINDAASLIEVDQTENGEFGRGFVKVFMKKKSELNLTGTIDLLQMQGSKCDATVNSGSRVKLMYILAEADRCDVTLEKDITLDAVDIYGDMASFYGRGKATEMNVFGESLTYTTEPEELNINDQVKIRPTHIVDPSLALTITFRPENGSSLVEADSSFDLKFSSNVRLTGSSDAVLTKEEAASLFELKKENTSGLVVPCDYAITDGGSFVTINPKGSLAHGTDYVLEIKKDSLTDAYKNTNDYILYKIHTTGSKSTETAALTGLKAGVLNGSEMKYSELSVSPDAANTYYIGTDAETLTIQASTAVPSPLIRVTMGSVTKIADEEGKVAFPIGAGTTDPEEITVIAGSYDGDYQEQSYVITVKRINADIQNAWIKVFSGRQPLTLYNSAAEAEAAASDSISISELSGPELLMGVTPAEIKNTDGIRIAVEKYNPGSKQYESVSASSGGWTLGDSSAAASASGIYRITLNSSINGTGLSDAAGVQTTVRYVNVSFAG